MKVLTTNKYLIEDDRKISYNKVLLNGITIESEIALLSEKFIEYQKDLFSEFLANLEDKLSLNEKISFREVQNYFEASLQNINSKLNLFSEKIKDVEFFTVKGFVNIYFNQIFLSSLIGEVSSVIFRDEKINYVVFNDAKDVGKINVFSEFIQGELENQDQVFFVGAIVDNIVEEKELEDILKTTVQEEGNFLETFEGIIASRVDINSLNLMSLSKVEFEITAKKNKLIANIQNMLKDTKFIKNIIISHRYPIIVSILVFVVLVLIFMGIKNIGSKDDDGVIINTNKGTLLTVEDVKKSIDKFLKMDPDQNGKAELYKEIMDNLNILEQNKMKAHDIKILKDQLTKEYYKQFKIFVINNLSEIEQYAFDDNELKDLGKPISLISNKGLSYSVGGDKGYLLGALNKNVRGLLKQFNLPSAIKGCTENLIKNGMYCFTEDGDLVNVTKTGIETVTTKTGKFPSNIKALGTYGSSNVYVLTQDGSLNSQGIYANKYVNIKGGINFGDANNLKFKNEVQLSGGFSSMAIDDNFFFWSPSDKKLYHYMSSVGNLRQLQLRGGSTLLNGFSSNVKVFAKKDSAYVYLLDIDNQTFTVYQTRPNKLASPETFELFYYYSLKFDGGENKVLDVYITGGSEPKLFLLSNKGIYKVDLDLYLSSMN